MGPQTFTSFSPVVPAIAQQGGRTKWQQPDQASEPRKTSPAPAWRSHRQPIGCSTEGRPCSHRWPRAASGWPQCSRSSLASVHAPVAGVSAGELGQHQCRRTWLASVQMDLAGISAGRHGQRPHGPLPVVIITSGCAREPHCVFGGACGNKHCALSSVKHLSIVNGWPVDPPKAKPFRCALEIPTHKSTLNTSTTPQPKNQLNMGS